MPLHRIIDNGLPPSEDAWADTTQWSVQSSSSRTIRLVNDDGTFTVLHGIGFTFDGIGEPTGGRVLSLERIAADGTTVLERLDFVNVSLTDLRAAFDVGGFVISQFKRLFRARFGDTPSAVRLRNTRTDRGMQEFAAIQD